MPSSVINSFSYHAESKILTIIFVSGYKYHYINVPQTVFNSFKSATSKGRYFNERIKNKFRFKKVQHR
ncbi:KTSC domain-containing protein [Agrobacterium tumefaciens]|nr:KTSC domain-containing protein [Agrobacterium tumefaciens]